MSRTPNFMNLSSFRRWAALGGLLLCLILVPFLFYEQAISEWTRLFVERQRPWWLVSSVLAGLLAADILLPVPSSVVSTAAGYLLGILNGTLVTWAGMSAACLIGYALGGSGGRSVARRWIGDAELERVSKAHLRHGDWVVVVCRAVPVLAEASVLFAGIVKMPFWRFLALTSLSNLGIALVYAAAGAYSLQAESFLAAFAGALALPAVAILLVRLRGI